MSSVQVSIEFTGRRLDVFKTEDGREVTPLKPIVELFGLSWKMQHRKFRERPAFARNLGVCIHNVMDAGGQNRDQICIEVDGVAPFLITLNSDLIRAKGNSEAADFLEAKFLEWKRVLAEYHRHGSVGLTREDRREMMLIKRSLVVAKLLGLYERLKEPRMKALVDQFIADLAKHLGYNYEATVRPPRTQEQLDLFDADREDSAQILSALGIPPASPGHADSAIRSDSNPPE